MSGRSTKNVLQPNEEGSVEIRVDTGQFLGSKTGTPFVRIENGYRTEVRLWVHARSREDVAFSQILDLAKIKRGDTPTTQMTVTFLGRPKLQVTGAKCDSNFLQINVRELTRGAAETTYQVRATVRADIPEGNWCSEVRLLTNDPEIPNTTVPVTVEVEPPPAPMSSPNRSKRWFRFRQDWR
jgi:hypothetical protein